MFILRWMKSRRFVHLSGMNLFSFDRHDWAKKTNQLLRLMEVHGLRTLFMLNMEGLHLRLHQFQYLLEQQFPTLAEHLTTHGMHPPMYASQWFLTCFVPCLPTNLVVRMYDFVFAQGAILTMMRVALSIMHKHHDKLLTITTFESLLSHLTQSSLLDKDDDGFTLPEDHQSAVTPAKLDTLAQTYRRQLEDERERAQQLVAVQLEKANNTKKPSRRESWFNWATTSTPATPTSPTTPSSIITTTTTTSSPVSVLHQQIEDLVTALSQLQKEHSQLNETMTAMKLKELDQDNERTKLSKRNAVLEKKIKKYKLKLAQVKGAASAAANGEEDGEHYKSFVNSLRMSGDFGALVATALAQDPSRHVEDSTANKTTSESKKERSKQNKRNSTSGQQQQQQQPREMTSELAVVKHANYELNQRYEQLTAQYSQAERDLMDAQSRQEQLNEQLCQLQSTVEQMHVDKEHLLQEHEELAKENEELMEKSMAAKRTQAELEYEKMALAKDMERLNQRIETLEKEKKEYLLPRSSFTEEVFTAHRLLFDPQPAAAATRRPSAPASSTATSHAEPRSEYESKYVESELRCRELEKLLAEAKVKLAEYETANMPLSPRASLHRRTSLMTTVTSPTTTDRRDSAESYASSITSATSLGSYSNTKRSSMYARLWNYTTSANTPARHSIAVLNKQQI